MPKEPVAVIFMDPVFFENDYRKFSRHILKFMKSPNFAINLVMLFCAKNFGSDWDRSDTISVYEGDNLLTLMNFKKGSAKRYSLY
jgi:hypothetical protein